MEFPSAWRAGVAALAADRERGASLLALEALALLERAGGEASRDAAGLAALGELARVIRSSRPSMPVIANVVDLAMHEVSLHADVGAAVRSASRAAMSARDRVLEARGGAAREAAALARGTVLTHSASETVTKALRAAKRNGTLRRVVVAEGRPGMEGRELARQLAEEGVDVLLVIDAALGLHAREADVALVGADAVLRDGSVVNKVGTRLLGMACARAGTPLYAAADRFKISVSNSIPLEEKGPEEVWPDAPAGVTVRNIYFDRTESDLVKGIASDAGLLSPKDIAPLAEEHSAWADWEPRIRRLTR